MNLSAPRQLAAHDVVQGVGPVNSLCGEKGTMGITLNFDDKAIKESLKGFKPMPKGNYPVVLLSGEEGIAESSGQPKVKITYQVAPDAPEGAGRQIIKDYSLQPKALWRWVNDMSALGGVASDYFDGGKVNVMDVVEANTGRRGIAVLDDPDEGYNNNKLNKIRPAK